jgi:hypothetical protein
MASSWTLSRMMIVTDVVVPHNLSLVVIIIA